LCTSRNVGVVCCAPQKPVSRPTEKQLASWLNATDKDTGPAESSITGLVFILATFTSFHVREAACAQYEIRALIFFRKFVFVVV
jgi:hypothetical protein